MFFHNSNDKIKKRIARANKLFDNFKRDEALRAILILRQEFPENCDVLFALAVFQNSTRQKALAIETFKSILKINGSHQDTLLILPTVIYEYDFENGNKIDLANGYKELALVEESLGNIPEARKFISKTLQLVSGLDRSEDSEDYLNECTAIEVRLGNS